MPNGGPSLTREIWAARPRVGATLWGGVTGGLRGAGWGAATGAAVGGPWGAAIGAGVGANIGITLGMITAASQKLIESMKRLEGVTRNLIEHYKVFSPAIARMRHQWELLDRRLNRAWADTIAPTLKKLTDIGTEFKERWNRVKIDFFQAIEPYLSKMLDFFRKVGRITLWLTSKLLGIIEKLLTGLTKLLEFFGFLEEGRERGRTQALRPFGMEWPTVEGPLTGAMRRAGITGPPFTTEEARRPSVTGEESEAEKRQKRIEWLERHGLLQGEPGREPPLDVPGPLPKLPTISINVNDSAELSASFERVWHEAAYALRKLEAENSYQAYTLQQRATYV